jgi:hypothetical protein
MQHHESHRQKSQANDSSQTFYIFVLPTVN